MAEKSSKLNRDKFFKNLFRSLVWLFVVSLVVLTIFMVIYFPNYAKLKKLRQANQKLRSDIETLEVQIQDLDEKLQKVDSNPELFEQFARDELGMAKEDEIVVDIEE